jgi:hypothetical protein
MIFEAGTKQFQDYLKSHIPMADVELQKQWFARVGKRLDIKPSRAHDLYYDPRSIIRQHEHIALVVLSGEKITPQDAALQRISNTHKTGDLLLRELEKLDNEHKEKRRRLFQRFGLSFMGDNSQTI